MPWLIIATETLISPEINWAFNIFTAYHIFYIDRYIKGVNIFQITASFQILLQLNKKLIVKYSHMY